MNAYFTATHGTLYQGDSLAILSELPSESVQCCVTSPPYWGLRDYGAEGQIGLEETPAVHIERLLAVFREVRRVLKNDGTLWVNYGDTYCNTDKWGGGGFNTGKQTVAADGKVPSWAARQRKSPIPGIKPKNLLGLPWRLAFALQDDGWILRSDIIWHKPNPMPESVKDRPTRAHEYLFLFSKQTKYFYDHEAVKEKAVCNSLKKFTDNGKCKQRGHGRSHAGFNGRYAEKLAQEGVPETRNLRSVWSVPTFPYPDAHFATFPPKLIKPCILAGSRQGDTVIDPFMGSGTIGMVARQLGRKWIGIEIKPEYCALALKRIDVSRLMLMELPGVEGGRG